MRPIVVAAGFVIGAVSLGAQCPDGAPPPCSDRRQAAPLRRVDPPLDDRTWIVVPFNNVTRAPDVDYLRDASVNLLYLDLAKWTDIRVIDDARVADLIREVPGARAIPVSFDAAMAMAKRAGAGRLVMGNVIKQGSRTTIAAKVFDVKKGTVIRSPQQDLVSQDSLMVVFGRLAADILDVAPPAGVDIAGIGTTRVGAYQQYLEGITALKRFDLAAARPRFDRALAIDPNFALAHYGLAILIGWENAGDTMKVVHGDVANRLASTAGLPVRERTLMKALSEFEHQRYTDACRDYGSLIRADSADVEALYGLGECTFHDQNIVPAPGDTARRVVRANMNVALRAFRRVLELDPAYHLAVQHILDAYEADQRTFNICTEAGCRTSAALYRADADTFVTEVFGPRDSIALRQRRQEFATANVRQQNLAKAREIAGNWVTTTPEETRAHIELAHIETLLGNYEAALRELAFVKGRLSETDMGKVYPDRLEASLKAGRMAEVRQLADSIGAIPNLSNTAAAYALALIGRPKVLEARVRSQTKASPLIQDFAAGVATVFVIGGTARTDTAEYRLMDSLARSGTKLRAVEISAWLYSARRPRFWPPLLPPTSDPRDIALTSLAGRDTARLRSITIAIDSSWRAAPAALSDPGTGLLVADLYLALGDSAAALRATRRNLDTVLYRTPASQGAAVMNLPVVLLYPRLMLMRADLEAAAGDRKTARIWYQRFIDLWSTADPELMPVVERERREMMRLSD